MSTQIIKLEFSIDEINTILSSLNNLPYGQVVQIINKIQAQAAPQVDSILAPKPVETTEE